MTKTSLTALTIATLSTCFLIPPNLSAQNDVSQKTAANRGLRYRFVDVGTFGGHNSSTNGGSIVINDQGVLVGSADTADACPYFPEAPIAPAFKWEKGVKTRLPNLPGGCSGFPIAINDHGLVVGIADTGIIDPATGGPAIHAVVWRNESIIDLGTFGGLNSLAGAVNNRGQVTGMAQNGVPDLFNFGNVINLPNSTEWRSFIWDAGVITDLGTLGGSDSASAGGVALNESGEVAAISFTSNDVNPETDLPTLDSFLWHRGMKTDLGTLGGRVTSASNINNQGQIIGSSNLSGDQKSHPFAWLRGVLTDLGTFGGDNGNALWNNDAGEVVGAADLPEAGIHHGFVWKGGMKYELPPLANDPCSNAVFIASTGLIAGTSTDCHGQLLHLFLSENGGPAIDMMPVIPPGAGFQLGDLKYMNNRGVITLAGVFPDGDEHAIVLIPCTDDESGTSGCQTVSFASQNSENVNSRAITPHPAVAERSSSERFPERRLKGAYHSHIVDFTSPK